MDLFLKIWPKFARFAGFCTCVYVIKNHANMLVNYLFSGKTHSEPGMFDKPFEKKPARKRTKKNKHSVGAAVYET